ncbi:MAG: methyltransferase domain-containing protein [Oscillospiraceae bacterium]|nr:methyltransferase domain-containing protein [Oscillospiraceae bacterium]
MNSSNNRIYGEVVDIDSGDIQSFYDKRAEKAQGENMYSSVLLNDHAPELVKEQMKIEEEILLPRLKLTPDSRVLDIGCGIGRWAEKVIGKCEYYHGVDFSQKMVETARERFKDSPDRDFKFERMSFQEFVDSPCPEGFKKFNRVIITCVLQYICDDVLEKVFAKLPDFLERDCVIYVWEPCGVGQRLTLKNFPSEALKSDYSVIYRTQEEYNSLFRSFTERGFSVTFNEYYTTLGGTSTFSDTDRIYYVLERV